MADPAPPATPNLPNAAPPAPRPRILTLDSLARYLLDRQIVTTADLVDDEEFFVEERSRRNRNFKVLRGGAPKLMVKQAGSLEPEVLATLRAEADLLEAVANDVHFKPIRWFSPALVHFDPDNNVLVTELVHPATSLTKFHLNQGEIAFAPEMAATCGRVLANFHALTAQAVRKGYVDFLEAKLPFGLRRQRLLQMMGQEAGEATSQFLQALRDTTLYRDSEALQEMCASVREVMHGDVRWDNFLLTHGGAPADNMNVRLIDWELVALGDSAWDVASFLAEYLRFWLHTAGMLTKDQDDLDHPTGAFELKECHPSARRFLDAYLRRRNLRGPRGDGFVARAGLYLPYAVVSVAFESTQRQSVLPYQAKLGLRMPQQALADPAGCMREWFGIGKEAAP